QTFVRKPQCVRQMTQRDDINLPESSLFDQADELLGPEQASLKSLDRRHMFCEVPGSALRLLPLPGELDKRGASVEPMDPTPLQSCLDRVFDIRGARNHHAGTPRTFQLTALNLVDRIAS